MITHITTLRLSSYPLLIHLSNMVLMHYHMLVLDLQARRTRTR
jgi:hypothetical protein